jgi:hypothetical protein
MQRATRLSRGSAPTLAFEDECFPVAHPTKSAACWARRAPPGDHDLSMEMPPAMRNGGAATVSGMPVGASTPQRRRRSARPPDAKPLSRTCPRPTRRSARLLSLLSEAPWSRQEQLPPRGFNHSVPTNAVPVRDHQVLGQGGVTVQTRKSRLRSDRAASTWAETLWYLTPRWAGLCRSSLCERRCSVRKGATHRGEARRDRAGPVPRHVFRAPEQAAAGPVGGHRNRDRGRVHVGAGDRLRVSGNGRTRRSLGMDRLMTGDSAATRCRPGQHRQLSGRPCQMCDDAVRPGIHSHSQIAVTP